jgi:hypothetical protein
MFRHTVCVSLATLLLALPHTAAAADNPYKNAALGVPASSPPPPLRLTDAQRDTVRSLVLTRHSDLEFQLKSTKAAKDVTPAVGAPLPTSVKEEALPSEVLAKIPALRNYWYVKMNGEVLIVDGMSRKVVDMFPQTGPLM